MQQFYILRKFIKSWLPLFLILVFISSCKEEEQQPQNELVNQILDIDYGNTLVSIDSLAYYSAADGISSLAAYDLDDKVSVSQDYYMFKVLYKTKNYDGSEITASGMLAVPTDGTVKGLVSWQHATNVNRADAPSKPTMRESIPLAAIFAGGGYVFLMADYIGLGSSLEVPTYNHVPSTVGCVVDFIKVGEKVLSELSGNTNKKLFLAGFSQGGSATTGTQRELEISNPTGLELQAAAAIAGPYNLKEISIPYVFQTKRSAYLGYIAYAYSVIYNQPLNSIIDSNYLAAVPGLFNGSSDNFTVLSAVPADPADLYTENMTSDILAGNSNWFTDALKQNQTYEYKPVAPLRLYYGETDTDVSKDDAIEAYNYMNSVGGNVELKNTGNFGHNDALLQALPEIQSWFNSL